ncbi:acyl-CoA thioesterase [Streptomyces sp. NBC_00249]|uniref:acyl-CoA thioesterase n=1 Tax=Streptomyces sp. NBC_00249 TaxID=2975690 RepID=UPI00225AED4F|nr:acyl-CoA thioesterase [Streptomyces sp. NBC_00249]MCX5199549.1 acyl-CoA thioesterase [Streptomyces sp. NBC_00249]
MTGPADRFEHRHTVAFAETGLCGTADYVNYLHWQGRCREMFLRGARLEAAADGGPSEVRLFTLQVECELLEAVVALDRLTVRMGVAELGHTQFDLTFDYVKETAEGDVPVARGRQRVACLTGPDTAPVPALIPEALAHALAPYAAATRPRAGRQT